MKRSISISPRLVLLVGAGFVGGIVADRSTSAPRRASVRPASVLHVHW
jgi:hypothetical protein